MSDGAILRELGDFCELIERYKGRRDATVVSARKAGVNWQRIADALGTTRQAARQKYAPIIFELDMIGRGSEQ